MEILKVGRITLAMHLSYRKAAVNLREAGRARKRPYVHPGLRIKVDRLIIGLYWKSEKFKTAKELGLQFSGADGAAGEKSVDSRQGFFYDAAIILRQGGDPRESAALFHTAEILKHRRPGSLGKALESEAGPGAG